MAMRDNENKSVGKDAMRLCPVCRMPISVLAIKCRYCGAEVGRPRKEQETFTVEDLGGEKIGTYTISGNVTEALESFMQEEQAQVKEEERERIEMNRRSLKGRLRKIAGTDSGGADETPRHLTRGVQDNETIDLSSGAQKSKKEQADAESRQRIFIVGLILAGLLLFYLAFALGGTCLDNRAQNMTTAADTGTPSRAREMLAAGGSLFEAHREALRALKMKDSQTNKEILSEIRAKAIESIKSRAFANPFDMKKLTSASRDITRMAEQDTDAELISLMKEINRETGYFAFILTELDPENETATFKLNNPALTEKEQQVKVGELLQQRFQVLAVNTSNVILEDTHPEAEGRRLISRKMMSVEAY